MTLISPKELVAFKKILHSLGKQERPLQRPIGPCFMALETVSIRELCKYFGGPWSNP